MQQYQPSLDGLRAVAVGIVLTAHAGFPYPRSGGVGVDVFFVLSGFLITTILSNEFATYGNICKKNFYARRFLRLLPCLAVACCLFAVLFGWREGWIPKRPIAISLTYTSNWAQAIFHFDMYWLSHCWSLACEEQYYLFWPFVILLLERRVKKTLMKGFSLLAVALVLSIYRYSMVGYFDAERIYYGLDTHMDGLVLGSALCYLVKGVSCSKPSWSAFGPWLSYILVPAAVVSLGALMYWVTWADPWMGKYGFTLAATLSALIIFDLLRSESSWLRPLLSNRVTVYAGKISYGLYLLHLPIYRCLDTLFPDFEFIQIMPIKLGVSFLTAAFSFHFIEAPFLKLKRHFEHAAPATDENHLPARVLAGSSSDA